MDPIGIDIPTAGDILVLGAGPDGGLTPDAAFPSVREAVNGAWRDDVQPRLTDVLRRELGKADRFAEGFTLYNIDVRLSAADPVQTVQRTAQGDVLVHVETGRSTIIATSTQPSFLGSYADPRFSIDFTVSFDLLLDIPPVTAPVGGSKVLNLRLVAPHLDSQNFPGDVILAVAKAIVSFVTGGSVDSLIQQAANDALGADQVNAALQPLNDALQRMLASGHRYLTLLAGDPQDLMRQLGAAAGQVGPQINALPAQTQSMILLCRQPDESGVIEGEISWPESAGEPMDPIRAAIVTSVASGMLPAAGLARVRANVEGGAAVPVDVAVAAGDLEPARLQAAAAAFTAAPMATQVQQGSLAHSPAVRLWDASVEDEPPGLADLGFAALGVEAGLSLRAFEPAAYESQMDVFRRGPKQFVVRVDVSDPGGGSHRTGRMVAMWHDTSDGWARRRYRIEQVETETPLTVSCQLDPEWRWAPGRIDSIEARNWSGTVTVRKAHEFAELLRDGDLQVSFATSDGSRRTAAISVLERAGAWGPGEDTRRALVIESGTPGDEVALNPQPLPPKWLERLTADRGDDRAIIVVGGRPGDEVALNPQPLPPRWRQEVADLVAQRAEAPQRGGGFQIRTREGWEAPRSIQRLAPRLLPRGAGTVLVRNSGRLGGAEGGSLLSRLGRGGVTRDGAGVQARRGETVSEAVSQAATAVVASVDGFGDLVASIDPDIFVPDTVNPTGYGSVRGIDFRVWPTE